MLYVLFIIFFALLAYDIRKGILIYAPFKLFFLPSIKLFGPFPFDVICSIVAVILYYARYHGHLKRRKIPWEYAIITGVVFAIVNGCVPEFNGGVLWSVFTLFLYAVIYFDSINSKNNLNFAIYSIIAFGLIMCVNGLIEYLTGTNFLREFQISTSVKGAYFSENDIERFGISHRVCSCMPHAICFGVVCVYFFFFIFYVIYSTKVKINMIIACISLLLLAVGIILSASRSPLLGMVVVALPFFVSKESFKLKNIMLISLIVLLAIYFAGDFLIQMFESMVYEDKAMEARGSGVEMRQTQFELTMMIWSQNPIFGHGHVALEQIDRSGLLRGAESLWFQLLIRRGIVGFISFILVYFFVFWDIVRTQKERIFKLCFWGSWIVINTVTSLPGLSDFLALMILCLMYKIELLGDFKFKMDRKAYVLKQLKCNNNSLID